jgi:hypothetical protein
MIDREQRQLPGVAVQTALEGALGAFDDMETRRWAGWVCYLLEGLEEKRPGEIEAVLEDVKDGIETRLEIGRW